MNVNNNCNPRIFIRLVGQKTINVLIVPVNDEAIIVE